MTELTEKQKETIQMLRKKAEETLRLCKQAESGAIAGEEFEKRVSKFLM